MSESNITNYIEIDGKDVLFDSLPIEKRKELSEKIQDKMMFPLGFRRKNPLKEQQ